MTSSQYVLQDPKQQYGIPYDHSIHYGQYQTKFEVNEQMGSTT